MFERKFTKKMGHIDFKSENTIRILLMNQC